jgi:Spy/CpxP family protein refolding chaperone
MRVALAALARLLAATALAVAAAPDSTPPVTTCDARYSPDLVGRD